MEEKRKLNFVLTVNSKFISVNDLYKAGLKYVAGRPKPYIYSNPKAKEMEREIVEQLRAVDFSEYREWLTNTKLFDVTVSFVVKSNVTRRDVQNMDKRLLDILTRYIKNDLGINRFDDSLFISVHFYKSIIPKSKHEYACISITESKSSLRFDQIETPEKFYLGPEKEEWKKEIKKELKARKLKCSEKEEDKNKCNTRLKILTPDKKQTITLEVANIINEVWECITSEIGFVYFGVLDSSEWTPEEKDQLEKTIELIKSISSGNSRIKVGFITEPKNILDL